MTTTNTIILSPYQISSVDETYKTGVKPEAGSWRWSAAPATSSSPEPSGCGTEQDSEGREDEDNVLEDFGII